MISGRDVVMEQIDDFNRAGKVLPCKIPDPFGAIANDDLLLGAAPAAFPGLNIESLAELFRILNRAGVGCRVGDANGIALFVPPGLCEYAAEFGFAWSRSRAAIGVLRSTLRRSSHSVSGAGPKHRPLAG